MKHVIFLSTLVFALSLLGCGGGDDGNGGNPVKKNPVPEKILGPWHGIDSGSLDGDTVTEWVRLLEFNDDVSVVYDGSGEDGSEEVCRRELREETFYEVCMPLEDDPWFILLPNNALVWHPLMFERFGTELSCYQYTDARGAKGDCDEIFSAIGGEDFYCQAGLVNGDRALRCSDDWGVAVNGGENHSKTVCRVHLSDNSGRCLGAPVPGVEDAALVLPMQRTGWEGYRSHRDNPRQFGVGDGLQLRPPQDLPTGAVLSYASEDEAVCSVDGDGTDGGMGGGVIAADAVAPDVCRIVLKVEAEGYADRILFADLPILKPNDAVWEDYVRPNNYFYPGETLAAGAVSSNDPAVTQNEYESLDDSICTVDGSTGEVAAVSAGECTIRLTATAPDYLDKVIEKTIPVDARKSLGADVTVTWPAFTALDDTTAVVGAAAVSPADPVVSDSALEWAVSHVSGDCQYDTGDLSFSNATECVLAVTVTGSRGSEERVEYFKIVPGLGTLALTWTGYGSGSNAATFGADALAPDAPVLRDGEYTWSATGGGCEVDAEDGTLTILAADACTVTLTATRSGYGDASVVHPVSIAVAAQTLAAPTHPYGAVVATLMPGDTVEIVNPPASDRGAVVYASGDSAVCTVDSATGEVTAVAPGSCAISAHLAATDNYAASDPVVLTAGVPIRIIATASLSAAGTWGNNPYGGLLPAIDFGQSRGVTTAPTGGTGGVLYRSVTPDICTVAGDGTVTGTGVGDCNVQFRFAGDAGTAASEWSASTRVVVGKASHPLPASNPYGSGADLRFGETLEFVTPPIGYGRVTYSLGLGSDEHCQLDETTGAITGIKLGVNACNVQIAFAGNNKYHPLTAKRLQQFSVVAAPQKLTFSDPYGAGPTLEVDGTLALIDVPVADQGGAVSYRDNEQDGSVCTVAADGTVTGVAFGRVCRVQAQAAVPADTNYAASEWVEIAAMEVGEGILSTLTWNPPTWGRVGTDLVLDGVNVGSTGATAVYAIADAGDTGCAFTGTSGTAARTLSFQGPGLCQVSATASATGYHDWVRNHYIRVRPGAIGVTVTDFASSAVLEVGAATPVTPPAHSGLSAGAGASWQLIRGERDCELVNPSTGAVRALPVAIADPADPPLCSLQLIARKTGFETLKSEIIDIPLQRGTIGDVTVKYGRGITPSLPAGSRVGIGSLTEAGGVPLALAGITTATDTVCGVDTDGTVTALGDSGTCTVTLTVSAVGYEDKVLDPINLAVTRELTVPAGATFSYADSLQIGVSTPLAVNAGGLPTDGGIVWKYRVEGDVCSVDEATGALTLESAAHAGDVCLVTAVATADGFTDVPLNPVEVAVNPGTLVLDNTDKPDFPADVKIGGIALPDTLAGTDDNSVAVTWGDWETGDASVCSVDETTGEIRASESAAVGDDCVIHAKASAPDYQTSDKIKIDTLEITAKGTLTIATDPVYSGDLNLRGHPLPVADLPQVNESVEVDWSYTATGSCSVDEASGAVTPGSAAEIGDTCQIVATASAPGYENVVTPAVTLTLKDTFYLAWAGFPTEATVGTDISLSSNQPLVVPSVADGASVTITATGNCAYNATSKVLSFTNATACVVTVAASKTGYSDIAGSFSVTPFAGTLSPTWNSYGTVTVGTSANAPTITNVPGGVTAAYEASSGCTVSVTGAVTGSAAGTCVVSVTLSVTGYADATHSYSVTVGKGSQSAPPGNGNPYGATPTLAVGADPKAITSDLATGQGDLVYSVHSSDATYCSVDGSSGAVTAKAAGVGNDCRIQAKYAGDANYLESSPATVATIGIIAGTFTSVTWSGYSGGTVRFGDTRSVVAPTSVPAADSFSYSTSSASSICTVDSSTGLLTAKQGLQTCVVEVTAHKAGYTNKVARRVLVGIWQASQGALVWTIRNAYGGSLAVGAAAKAISGTLPTGGQGPLQYSNEPNTHCSVDSTGAVTAKPAGVDGICSIFFRFAGNDNYKPSPTWVLAGSVNIVAGTLTPTWNSYGAVTVGNATSAPSVTAVNASGAAVTVSAAYSQASGSSGCTVDTSTGAVTGSAVSSSCKVKVVLSATGYDDIENTYTISVAAAE